MRRCHECGFPMRFARYFDWRSDGTILGTDRVRMQSRIAFLELGEMEGLFDDLSLMLGVSIEHILIEAEKNIGKAFYASTPLRYLKYAPRNPRLRPSWVAKAAVRGVSSDVAGLGSGILRAESYDPRGSMVLRISNPVFIARTVGNSIGIYESIERIHGAEYEYHLDGGDLVLAMRHPSGDTPPEPLSETRLRLDEIVPGEGTLAYNRCGTCRTPLDVSRALEWDLSRGIITNRVTGKRESVGAVQSVNAMMRELEAELGDDVFRPLYECQKEITRQQLERDGFETGGDFWDRFFYSCAIKGLGFPLGTGTAADAVTVEIANAYERTLYAARVASAMEYSTGKLSRIEWEMRRSDLSVFTVSVAS
ncbi:MAG: hypothetical protein ACYC99_15815 [Candidatus Geothermincolia bacterium]